jgi:hypothetical protein
MWQDRESPMLTPPVFEIAGLSMEPSLRRGWKVRVEPVSADPEPGALVVLETRSGHLLHRVLHVARFRDGVWLFHRGDAGGRVGMTPGGAVVGRVIAVLLPPDQRLPTLDRLSPTASRTFVRARIRSRLYAACRAVAHSMGLFGTPAARLGGRLFARLLG